MSNHDGDPHPPEFRREFRLYPYQYILEQQPDLNWCNPELVDTMHDVLHFWLQKGVDGFRLDAITTLIKNDTFPDMPPDDPKFQGALLFRLVDVHNHVDLHPILKNFRSLVDRYAGSPVLIEETNAANFYELMSFYGNQLDSLHLPMNLRTTQFPWNTHAIGLAAVQICHASSVRLRSVPNPI